MNWPNPSLSNLLDTQLPIIQAPMAGCDSIALAIAVSNAGGLGSLACALLTPQQIREAISQLRAATANPFNLNFFCHPMPTPSPQTEARWKEILQPYYTELNLNITTIPIIPLRQPFNTELCSLMEELRPPVISFHFGLPEAGLCQRLKACGIKILSSATTVEEALWLEAHGCDAIIAQGAEAGGHRAMFLTEDLTIQHNLSILLPQILGAVRIPVIAAGGIATGQDIAENLQRGAAMVQLGTAYLLCPEATVSPLYRQALQTPHTTTITNLFSGRPARSILNRLIRELGPISPNVPAFPLAAQAISPLRKASEALGTTDFMQLWAGTAAAQAQALPAAELTQLLAAEAQQSLTTSSSAAS